MDLRELLASTLRPSADLQIAVIPPSTAQTAPVTYEASSDARKAMTAATSSARPVRPRGIPRSASSSRGSSETTLWVSGVSMKPGSTPFTRIAERRVVVRHHADQAVDTGFARAVRVLSRRQAVEAGWAGRTHHRAALRLEQSSHAVLAGQEGPGEIDVDDPAPHARVETVGAVIDLGGLDRGIGHDDVEPAEASCGGGCRHRDVVLDADVGHERERIASGRRDEGNRAGRGSLVDVDHGHARAFDCEANRGSAARCRSPRR